MAGKGKRAKKTPSKFASPAGKAAAPPATPTASAPEPAPEPAPGPAGGAKAPAPGVLAAPPPGTSPPAAGLADLLDAQLAPMMEVFKTMSVSVQSFAKRLDDLELKTAAAAPAAGDKALLAELRALKSAPAPASGGAVPPAPPGPSILDSIRAELLAAEGDPRGRRGGGGREAKYATSPASRSRSRSRSGSRHARSRSRSGSRSPPALSGSRRPRHDRDGSRSRKAGKTAVLDERLGAEYWADLADQYESSASKFVRAHHWGTPRHKEEALRLATYIDYATHEGYTHKALFMEQMLRMLTALVEVDLSGSSTHFEVLAWKPAGRLGSNATRQAVAKAASLEDARRRKPKKDPKKGSKGGGGGASGH